MDKFNPIPFKKVLKQALKDPKVKAEYDHLGPEYDIIEAIIRQRLKKGLTQKQLAQKMGTKQSALSRLESGNYNPSLAFLKKVATALNSQLHINLS